MNFEKLDRFLDTMPQRGFPACSLLVTQNGKPIYTRNVGFSDLQKNTPATENDLYWVCSISKVTTCVAAMQLVEQGRLGLDDPVASYLPAFKNIYIKDDNNAKTVSPAKTVMTVKHLFTMTGGLDYKLTHPSLVEVCENKQATTREVVDAMAKIPLHFEPGTHFRYSLCHDVLAAVVEVVSGMRFGDYVKKYILDPLDMKDTGYHLPAALQDRMTTMYRYVPGFAKSEPIKCENKYCLTDNYDSGGAGLYTSPADQIKLLTALACGGKTPNGESILRPETIAMMGKNQLCDSARIDFEPTRLHGYSWGLCGRAHVDPKLSDALSSVGEFGWDGATGSFALVDPAKQVALYFGLHIFGCQYVYHHIHPRLRDMVFAEINSQES